MSLLAPVPAPAAPHAGSRLPRAPDGFPPALRGEVEAALSARFGGAVRAEPREVLSSRISPVRRVALSGPAGVPESVVVKHLAAPWYGDPGGGVPRDFLEEAAAYAFLDGLADRPFRERAALLAWLPGGALVLEDLGAGERTLPTPRIGDLLAVSFARLHAATAGRGAAHEAARRRMGIDIDGPDPRYDGVDAASRRFARGAEMLAEWCEALSVATAAEVREQLAVVEAAVLHPGPFAALVHDDLAAGRQCVVRGGRLLLLDWENAKQAHALRDLAKVLVGKFERSLDTGAMVRVCPEMDPSLVARYRRELARAGGPDVDDATWGEALSSAVLFGAVVQVGALLGLYPVTPVTGEVLPNLRDLLLRTGEVLHALPGREDLRRILLRLAGHAGGRWGIR